MTLCLKFINSEKATKFCEIVTLLLAGTTKDKSKVKISQNFVAFSEYMNFKVSHFENRAVRACEFQVQIGYFDERSHPRFVLGCKRLLFLNI